MFLNFCVPTVVWGGWGAFRRSWAINTQDLEPSMFKIIVIYAFLSSLIALLSLDFPYLISAEIFGWSRNLWKNGVRYRPNRDRISAFSQISAKYFGFSCSLRLSLTRSSPPSPTLRRTWCRGGHGRVRTTPDPWAVGCVHEALYTEWGPDTRRNSSPATWKGSRSCWSPNRSSPTPLSFRRTWWRGKHYKLWVTVIKSQVVAASKTWASELF